MCNITYLPAGISVPAVEIENAATWNDDGHGWAVAAEPGVMLTGRYMDFDTALTTFEATRKAFANRPAMFHSRLATHGTISLNNVHPFSVGKYAAVAHNGILPTKFQPAKGQHMSDTAIMARYWLAGRAQVSGIWTRKERRRIGRIIGTGNKLCILSVSPFLPEPTGYLVNGGQGYWDNATGAWFSSDSYRYAWTPKSKSSLSGGGWLWDSAYDEWIGSSATKAKDTPSECPNCGHGDQIDLTAGVCLECDFCLDCLSMLRECLCYTPTARKEEHFLTAEEAMEATRGTPMALDDEIEIRMTELGGQS